MPREPDRCCHVDVQVVVCPLPSPMALSPLPWPSPLMALSPLPFPLSLGPLQSPLFNLLSHGGMYSEGIKATWAARLKRAPNVNMQTRTHKGHSAEGDHAETGQLGGGRGRRQGCRVPAVQDRRWQGMPALVGGGPARRVLLRIRLVPAVQAPCTSAQTQTSEPIREWVSRAPQAHARSRACARTLRGRPGRSRPPRTAEGEAAWSSTPFAASGPRWVRGKCRSRRPAVVAGRTRARSRCPRTGPLSSFAETALATHRQPVRNAKDV